MGTYRKTSVPFFSIEIIDYRNQDQNNKNKTNKLKSTNSLLHLNKEKIGNKE